MELRQLRRTTRRVEVTEAGELVLTRARRALTEVDGVRADLDALGGLVRGALRLGGVPPEEELVLSRLPTIHSPGTSACGWSAWPVRRWCRTPAWSPRRTSWRPCAS